MPTYLNPGTPDATTFQGTNNVLACSFIRVWKPAPAITPSPSPSPSPTTGLKLGVYLGGTDPTDATTAAFETFLHRTVDYNTVFTGNASQSDFTGSVGTLFAGWKPTRKLLVSQPLVWTGGDLNQASLGTYDASYTSVSQTLVTNKAQIFMLRLGWECNGTWFPWSFQTAPNTAANYVSSFRRFVANLRANGGTGILIDWNVNWGQADPTAAYPGDDVVDVISMDLYENTTFLSGQSPATRWANFRSGGGGTLVGLDWLVNFSSLHSKPMAVPEYATNFNETGSFVQNMHDFIVTHNFSYQSYWDFDGTFQGNLTHYPLTQQDYFNNWHG